MKIGELRFNISALPVEARGLEMNSDEFKDVTRHLKQLSDQQLEIERLRAQVPHPAVSKG